MKKILLIIAIAISTNIYAQKGSSQFSLFGGFHCGLKTRLCPFP